MATKSAFVAVGVAQALLNIRNRRKMQDLFEEDEVLPYVYLASRHTRLLPIAYLRSLATFLGGRSATAELIREFNETREASRLANGAWEQLQEKIDSQSAYTLLEISKMLGVARMTVNRWVKENALEAEPEARQGRTLSEDDRLTKKYLVKAETLRAFITWVTPFEA